MRAFHARSAFAALTVLSALSALAQPYPARPIRLAVSGVGGSSNFAAHLISQGLSQRWGVPVVVDSRQSGAAVSEIVARAQPDGHTLLLNGSTLWLLPLLHARIAYDPIRDFAPVTLAMGTPSVLVVHPALPARSVQELIRLAKEKPGQLNYGSGSIGATNHLAAELLKAMAQVDIVGIKYNGAAAALTALIAGEVQVHFSTAAAVLPHAKTNRLRALAVTSAQPTRLAPGLPTMAAAGLPGYEMVAVFGIFAPSRTPPSLIQRLNDEITAILKRPEVSDRLFASGLEVIASSPEELGALVKSDIVKWKKIITQSGMRVP